MKTMCDQHCQGYLNPDKPITRKVLSANRMMYLGTGKVKSGEECLACVLYILHKGDLHFFAFNQPYVHEQFWNATATIH